MDYWRVAAILNKRKWFIVLSVMVGTVLTYGATRLIGSTWVSTIQFVAPRNSNLSGTQEDAGPDSGPQAMANAKSQALVLSAVAKSSDVLIPSLHQIHQVEIAHNQLKNIDVVAISPRMFELQVTDSSIGRSENLANALAGNFLKSYQNLRMTQAKKTVQLLETQLRGAVTKLAQAQQKYDAYRDAHNISGTLNATFEGVIARVREARHQRDGVEQRIAETSARLRDATAQRDAIPAKVNIQVQTDVSPEVKRLQDELSKAENQLSEYRAKYNDTMPVVLKAIEARDATAAKLKAASTKKPPSALVQPNPARLIADAQVRDLLQQISGSQALRATLDKEISKAQLELGQFKNLDSPIGVLAAEVASQTEARGNLAMRLRYARAQQDATETLDPLQMVDKVSNFNPPVNASEGKSIKMVAIGAICSLLAMCGLVIGLDSLDRRVRSVKEAEIALPAPIIAAIPQPMGAVTFASLARVTELHPQSIHSESYRFLGMRLLSPDLRHVRSLMMLSAKAEQGSTTTIANLGITLAQSGKRVIIVDANVRTSELHTVFGIDNYYGYTDLLLSPNDVSLTKALHETSVPNLRVVTSGPQPANPWELFRSPAVTEVAQRLEGVADYVLYDTPSSVIFTDALNLAPVTQAAFLCVRALEHVTGAEERLVKQLEEAHVPVLGCILTDVPTAVVEGFANYQHYYGPAANAKALAPGTIEGPISSDKNGFIQLPQGPDINVDLTDEDKERLG